MNKISKSILQGAKEALTHAQGHRQGTKIHKAKIPKHVNVHAIRSQLHMTRKEFADR